MCLPAASQMVRYHPQSHRQDPRSPSPPLHRLPAPWRSGNWSSLLHHHSPHGRRRCRCRAGSAGPPAPPRTALNRPRPPPPRHRTGRPPPHCLQKALRGPCSIQRQRLMTTVNTPRDTRATRVVLPYDAIRGGGVLNALSRSERAVDHVIPPRWQQVGQDLRLRPPQHHLA